jgi:hypothetical protein
MSISQHDLGFGIFIIGVVNLAMLAALVIASGIHEKLDKLIAIAERGDK